MKNNDIRKKKFSGVVIPAITPLTADYKLDYLAVEKMFHHFHEHHVHPFILGTTGESASLPWSMKFGYIALAGKLRSSGSTLYAGISSNCLEESIELGKRCAGAGVDVVAATLPSYYALSNDQVKKYFETLANDLPIPLIIYNIPATTHMSVSLDIIDQLSHHENIVGTKDSERSETRLSESLKLWSQRDDFSHFLGWAAKSAEALIGGSDGLIPSTGNLHPGLYDEMSLAVQSGDHETAFRCQRLSDVLGDVYQKGRLLGESIAALKALMKGAAICEPFMMPPLQHVTSTEQVALITELEQIISKEGIKLSKIYTNA